MIHDPNTTDNVFIEEHQSSTVSALYLNLGTQMKLTTIHESITTVSPS